MSDRDHSSERVDTIGGASSSHKSERYDLIPPEALLVLARRFGLGAEKYQPNQWKRGDREFIKARINHLLAHYQSLLQHNDATIAGGDDDLGGIMWAGAALAWFRANKPEEYWAALQELSEPLRELPAEGQTGVRITYAHPKNCQYPVGPCSCGVIARTAGILSGGLGPA